MAQLFAWDFAGTGQAAVADLAGNGRGFTPTGNNTRTAAGGGYTYGGLRPNAVGFRQTASDAQTGPSITGLNVAPRTLCGWAIVTGSANGWVISMDRVDGGNPSGTGVFGIYNNSGAPQFRCKDNSGSAFTRSFTGNAAYRFYALTYDGTNLKCYQSDGAGAVAQVGANIAMGSVWDATRILLLQQMGTGATLSDWQMFDTAMSLTQLQALADTPLGTSGTAAGTATETDTAQAAGRIRSTTAGTVTETDTAQPAGRARATTSGFATENDAAQAITSVRTTTAGTATEADTAQPAGRTRTTTAAAALEVDTAVSPAGGGATPAGTALELDTAQPAGRTRTTTAGTALEADVPQSAGRIRATALAPAAETDVAVPAGRIRATAAAAALEVDTALSVTGPNPPTSNLLLIGAVESQWDTAVQSQWHAEIEGPRFTVEVEA